MSPAAERFGSFIGRCMDDAIRLERSSPARQDIGRLVPEQGAPRVVHLDGELQAAYEVLLEFEKDARIKWLQPLVMSGMSPSANLHLAVITRIESLLSAETDRGLGSWRQDTPLDRMDGPQAAIRALVGNAAIGFDGNLAERGAALDPESWAVESVEAERARIAFDRQFREALDVVARAIRYRDDPSPLFVLTVSDMEFDQERTEMLLSIVRYLGCPRMPVVLLGSLERPVDLRYLPPGCRINVEHR